MQLSELSGGNPRIVAVRNQYDSLPYVDVAFPATGTVWRYEFSDQAIMDMTLRKYRRNVGRLVAKMREQAKAGKVTEKDVTGNYRR